MRTEVTPEQARNARVVGAILAAILALNAIEGMFAPLAGGPAAAWNTLPLVLALCWLVLVWRKPSPRAQGYALLALLFTVVALAYARWGFNSFTQGLAYVVAALLVAVVVAIVVAIPIAILRAVRWPAEESEPMALLGEDAPLPLELAGRVAALEAIGFVRRAARRREDPNCVETAVFLTHASEGVLALAWHAQMSAAQGGATILGAQSSSGSDARVTVTDQPGPAPFPSLPARGMLRFPGHSAEALLDHVRHLSPSAKGGAKGPPPNAEEVQPLSSRWSREYRHWLIAQGYIRAQPTNGMHRPTFKGAVVALARLLWPGRALLRGLDRRRADAALEGR